LVTGACVQGDSVAAAAAFLLDAAAGGVSERTVVQVLQHWVDDGMSCQQVIRALAAADESCAARHRPLFETYRAPITSRFA